MWVAWVSLLCISGWFCRRPARHSVLPLLYSTTLRAQTTIRPRPGQALSKGRGGPRSLAGARFLSRAQPSLRRIVADDYLGHRRWLILRDKTKRPGLATRPTRASAAHPQRTYRNRHRGQLPSTRGRTGQKGGAYRTDGELENDYRHFFCAWNFAIVIAPNGPSWPKTTGPMMGEN